MPSSFASSPLKSLPASEVYTDLAGLQQIRAQGRENKDAALEQIARQFESLLISQMLKSMRDANQVFAEGNPLSSNEEQLYRDMFDQQLSLSLGGERGIGIAEAMVRQLKRSYGDARPDDANSSAATLGALPNRPTHTSTGHYTGVASATDLAPDVSDLSSGHEIRMPARHVPVAFDGDPETFVKALYPIAEQTGARLGLEPEVLLAQAALETGWGAKMLVHRDGRSSFNLFNIKANEHWQGPAVATRTLEYRDGLAVREAARFRAYASPEESFADYAELLATSPRYSQALNQAGDAEQFVRGLADAGYATDPAYADKVLGILNTGRVQAAARAGSQ
ncbi:MAG: flagellar assembly peptidoglycan hydrolase FlgJ [Spongiibacteraceae bacterium]|jgi:flagellar protein FlgJ|nr:flagellar assembly peptidoglycan hydrolase FlgJ [Spongiibacteraceae bacterium]